MTLSARGPTLRRPWLKTSGSNDGLAPEGVTVENGTGKGREKSPHMQVSVTGKQVSIGAELRDHVQRHLTDLVSKYFDHAIESTVVLSRSGHSLRADITVHVGRGILVQGHGETDNPFNAFEVAADRIAKQLRRYKRRLREHRVSQAEREILSASQYVLAAPDEAEEFEDPEEGQPVVIAEMTTEIESLSVSEAVMRMDLADARTLVFRNAAHGGLNVLYRREDGNIGWVDPDGLLSGSA